MTADPASRLIEAIRGGSAPAAIRGAAARGALPLAPEVLVLLQMLLTTDDDPAIREAAESSLTALAPQTAATLAFARDAAPEVLAYLAGSVERWPECGPALARRPDLPPGAASSLASCRFVDVVEALSGNHRLLATQPQLGAQLLGNEALAGPARTRLLDVLEEFEKSRAARAESADAGDQAVAARDPFLAALGVDAEVEALLPELGLEIEHLADKSELLGEEDQDALALKLAKMNVGQKLRRALFGTTEERAILVRDTNRLIACAVVKNPKFTEQEADLVSRSRNVNTEVLRQIGTHREFAKSYQIQRNLVTNPRAPNELVIRYIPRLQDRDLKLIHGNRNLPESVRRQARKILDAREERRRVRIGPGRR